MQAMQALILAAGWLAGPFSPSPDSNFPGGAFIADLVNYSLYIGFAAATIGVIAGASTLYISSRGGGGVAAHQWGVRMLVGGLVGLAVLATITTIIG